MQPVGSLHFILLFIFPFRPRAEHQLKREKPALEQTNLDKTERQEGHIVSAEQGVEQHFLDTPVEVALQLLHLSPNQFRRVRVCRWWAGVNGHVGGAGELLAEVLPQQEEEVARAKEWRLCQLVLLVVCWVVALCCCCLAFASLLVETAKGDVHPESETKGGEESDREQRSEFKRRRAVKIMTHMKEVHKPRAAFLLPFFPNSSKISTTYTRDLQVFLLNSV